jgi:hypothetical protein
MSRDHAWTVVAVGTWLYDGTIRHKIELLSRPATLAYSRWIEDEKTGEFVVDASAPIPTTADGLVYYVAGSEFLSVADAIAWADQQPWGPVQWVFTQKAE